MKIQEIEMFPKDRLDDIELSPNDADKLCRHAYKIYATLMQRGADFETALAGVYLSGFYNGLAENEGEE